MHEVHGCAPLAAEMSSPLEVAFQNDDYNRIAELIGSQPQIDYPVAVSGGSFSPLYIALREGAVATSTYLLALGANPEANFNGVSARSGALRKASRRCLAVLFRAGLQPSGEELLAFACSGEPSIIPENDLDVQSRQLLAELDFQNFIDCKFDAAEIGKLVRRGNVYAQVRGPADSAIAGLRSSMSKNRDPRFLPKKLDAERLIAQTDHTIESGIDKAATELGLATQLMLNQSEKICEVIRRYFSPFRFNLGILEDQASRATAALSEFIAPTIGFPEDHPWVIRFCRTIVMRYPVREVLEGRQEANLASDYAPGIEFERHTASMLLTAGFSVDITPVTGDQGADLIASKAGLTYAIQCKDFGVPVGNTAVQEVIAAKAYYGTDYAAVCAPNGFTKSAWELAARSAVILLKSDAVSDIDKFARNFG